MPAGPAWTPWGFPAGFAWFAALPEGEVEGVLLAGLLCSGHPAGGVVLNGGGLKFNLGATTAITVNNLTINAAATIDTTTQGLQEVHPKTALPRDVRGGRLRGPGGTM